MSKGTKIALGIVGGLLTICALVGIAGFFIFRSVGELLIVDNPDDIAAAADEMIDYQLPRGDKEEGLLNILVYKMLMISPENSGSSSTQGPLITIIQFSQSFGAMDEATMDQIQQSMEDSAQTGDVTVQLISTEEVTIRDQRVTISHFAGEDSTGTQIRQTISSPFTGKNGTLMLMIMGSEAGWSDAVVDAFIGSLR